MMKNRSIADRLAVCSWSLQPPGAEALVENLKHLGLGKVQVALDPIRTHPDRWRSLPELCARESIQIVSGMVVTVGEDYSTLESIRRTGGVVPDQTWEENWANLQANLKVAQSLGLKLITFHAGFLPEDASLPEYRKLQDRLVRIADLVGGQGIELGLETGQETASHLAEFLERVQRPNLGVNFDPANMILYDKGDPIEALRTLSRWLKQCHIKDANRTAQPGTWGEEVATGSGQVDWRGFFQTLEAIGYQGCLAIEREAGNQRFEDILTARKFVEGLVGGA